jgi:hypothetical protein
LPKGIRNPRVAIQPEQALIACLYDNGKFQTVISLGLEIHLTDEPNTLAVCIRNVRAGLLPVPITGLLAHISAAARDGKIPLRWAQAEGDPVALVTVPAQHQDYGLREIHLDTVELREGEILVAGQTDDPLAEASIAQQRASSPGDENVILHR